MKRPICKDDKARGCRRVGNGAQWVYFNESAEDFEVLRLKNKFQEYGELEQLRATCQSFNDDNDAFYDNDVFRERCQQASAGSPEAL